MTSEQPSDPLELALALASALEESGTPYAIGGALAYGIWGVPRATIDVDINVFVEGEELQAVLEAMAPLGVAADLEQVMAASADRGMFVVHTGLFRIDVFTPSIPFCAEAERTRVRHAVDHQEAWFLSAEALAVFKLLFFRAKDIVDLQRLIAVQGDRLDTVYVRRQIVEMMGDDDERVTRWDELVAEHST